MSKSVVSTEKAPAAIGPYSQAVKCSGKMVFCSGQVPIDPSTQELLDSNDVSEQTELVLKNLSAVLGASECSMNDVVRTTIFLKDLSDFNAVNAVYAKFFQEPFPARACVEVARLPKDVLVEIDAIAVQSESR